MTKYKFYHPLYPCIWMFLLCACLIFPKDSFSQTQLLLKKDSITVGDTIKTINPGGLYVSGAFTIRSTAIGDTLWPMARYGTSSEWVKTSVKNIRTQSSDTNIIITATSWPVDYELNDPCIVGFRLISKGATYLTSRKTYVNFRFRREK